GLQIAQHEGTEGDADEPVHRQPKMLHDPAHLAVLALADRDQDPNITALLAFERCLDWAVAHPVYGEAAAELLQLRLADLAEAAHTVAPGPAGSRKLKMAREIAIICQKQKPFGIEIEPSHRNQARQPLGKGFENSGSAFGVFMGRHAALRLIIAPKPWRLAQ